MDEVKIIDEVKTLEELNKIALVHADMIEQNSDMISEQLVISDMIKRYFDLKLSHLLLKKQKIYQNKK